MDNHPPKVKQTMDPEDEELLWDDEMKTPKKIDGIKKDIPTDKGVIGWLKLNIFLHSLLKL